MNWNNNDTKYIFKRLIVYLIIVAIGFFACQKCVKAAGDGMPSLYVNNTTQITKDTKVYNAGNQNVYFKVGETGSLNGEIYNWYSVAVCSAFGNNPERWINGYYVNTTATLDNVTIYNTSQTCTISGTNAYNATGRAVYFVLRLKSTAYNIGQGQTHISYLNDWIGWTFYQTGSTEWTLIEINRGWANEDNQVPDYSDLCNGALDSAINNQTTAINNQTQWFEEQHDPLLDTGFLDVMGDLITTNDSDVVRQFILIPFNLFVQIYNACTSNECSALTLGTLYGTTLTLPCINWTSLVGSAIANTIDIIFSACLIFGMYRMIKHMINKIFTLSSTITDECGVEVFK